MKKIVSGTLVTLMIAGSTVGSFAAVNFSDVPNNHWAKEYINKMADKKIISGYFDDYSLKTTFKPDQSVTYIEAMQMIYNTLKISNQLKSTNGLVAKHSAVMKENKIPQWAQEAMAYGLEYGIFRPDDLKLIIKNEKQVSAKKVDVAVFIGKAVDMKDQIDPLPVLNFKDADSISTVAKPYVDLLAKKNIVSGDDQKKFNPNSIVNRAVMATMCSKTYDLLSTNNNINNTNSNQSVMEYKEGMIEYLAPNGSIMILKNKLGEKKSYNVKTIYAKKDDTSVLVSSLKVGDSVKVAINKNSEIDNIEVMKNQISMDENNVRTIDYVSEDTNMIMLKDEKGNTQVYNVKGVKITINGKAKRIDDLSKGDIVKLYFDRAGDLEEIKMDKEATEMEGQVISLVDKGAYYLLTVRDKKNFAVKKDLKVYDTVEIKQDKEKISIKKLVEGEHIWVKYSADRAMKIEIDSKEVIYDGILESKVLFRGEPMIKLRLNDGKVMDFEIADKATIRRDRHRSELDELQKGDLATVTVKYNRIVEILAAGIDERSKDEGTIKQIIIGDPSKITIETDDKATYTYEVSDSVRVDIDGKSADLKDLNVHYKVKFRIENNKVYRIDADKKASKDTITGEVIRVYDGSRYVAVRYFDKNKSDYVKISVLITDDTKIIGTDGKDMNFKRLREDDTVVMDGRYDGDIFIANRIVQWD
ncbi:S-layer homology domain-containing protein [Anaerophilus nitritogenes]|uniref:S-layer homology domain-containing protein n=1 Tax=Anaerophilus nitritogenes TaxID=2498136 RepID=UPI00101D2D97|nr:S-layer homology domain-containing protein [Anaerophilus nitritogenes]